MDTKLKIVMLIAVVLFVVAVVEGVLLLRLARQPPVTVAKSPAEDAPGASSEAALAQMGSPERPVAESAAPQGPAKEAPRQELSAAPPAQPAEPEPAPVHEQKDAAEKPKLEETVETKVKRFLDPLKLSESQRQQAALVIQKLTAAMTESMDKEAELKDVAGRLELKAMDLRRTGRLTEEQIIESLKPERAEIQEQVLRQTLSGLADVAAALEELRPVLDARQALGLDAMLKAINMGQEVMRKMSADGATQKGTGSDNPAP